MGEAASGGGQAEEVLQRRQGQAPPGGGSRKAAPLGVRVVDHVVVGLVLGQLQQPLLLLGVDGRYRVNAPPPQPAGGPAAADVRGGTARRGDNTATKQQ